MRPVRADIPTEYWRLLDWYDKDYQKGGGGMTPSSNPSKLLAFVGAIAAFDLQMMTEAIRAGSEQVDENAW